MMTGNRERQVATAVVVMSVLLTAVLLTAVAVYAQEEMTVTGSVVGPDGQGLAGVTVWAPYLTDLPDRHYVWGETETDQDGSFALQVETPPSGGGDYLLVASKNGYAIGVAKTKLAEEVRIRLSDERVTLRGAVADAAGEPLAGVTITPRWLNYPKPGGMGPAFSSFLVGYARSPLSVTTGVDGSFVIEGLALDSRITVVAEGAGFVDEEARAEIGPEDAVVSIVMQREARISGRVLRDGEHVAGVRITVSSATPRGGTATSDEQGYSIGGLAEGVYTVCASSWHEDQITRMVVGVRVGVGEHVEGVDLELVEGGVVEGLVRDEETGEPLPGVHVSIRHADLPKHGYGYRTDDDGHYEARVAPGQVTVKLSRVRRRSSGRSSVSVTVENGERVTATDLFAQTPSERRVLVTDENGEPVGGAQVWLADSTRSYPPREPALTDATGYAVLPRGPMMAQPEASRVFACKSEAGLAGLAPLREDGEVTNLRLTKGGYLTAQVLGPDGNPLGRGGTRVQVSFIRHIYINLPPRYATDEAGVLRIGPLPTGVSLTVQLDPVTDAMAVDEWPAWGTVRLAPGQTSGLHTLRLDPAGRTVSGVVRDADGDPVAVQVVSMDTTDLRSASVPTDAEGRFSLGGLRWRGTVTLVAHTDDGKLACSVACDPDLGLAAELVVEPVGIVEGIVYQPDGTPCPKARVSVSSSHLGRHHELPAGLVSWHSAVTDERGRWRVEGLVPGLEYRVSSYTDGGGSFAAIENFTALPGPMPVAVDAYLVEH